MNNLKLKTFTLLSLLGFNGAAEAQSTSKGLVTETYKVYGNCGMCKKTIETAAGKKAKTASWNEDTKILSVSYNSAGTNSDEILKAVAYAGYDNDKYLAPLSAYNKLPSCCQYERSEKAKQALVHKSKPSETEKLTTTTALQKAVLEGVYQAYFDLKDALVKSDAGTSAAKAKELLNELSLVKMESLSNEQHQVYMKKVSSIKAEATAISNSKDISLQRERFSTLSDDLFELMKSVKPAYTIYRDHCPMYNDGKGANWISKESQIKNPYYGSQMMTCGKVTETIK